MIATKLFIKWLWGVSVFVSAVGGVAYKINNDIQVQKKEENIKKISSKTIELDKLIEKLKELKERLKVVEQNILSKEKEISDLEQKNLESKISEKTLNTEIESLTVAIEELSQKIQEKTTLKNEKQIEESDYQTSVNSWTQKILQNGVNKKLKNIALAQATNEFNSKKKDLDKVESEKNEARKEEQSALSKKASDANVVSGLKVLLAEQSRQQSKALNLYNQKKSKICGPRTDSRANPSTLMCKNAQNQIFNKSEAISQQRLNQLSSDLEQKKITVANTTKLLREKEAASLDSQQDWNNKTSLLNTKTRLFNEKEQTFGVYKKKKTAIENEIKKINSTIVEEQKKLNLIQTSLQATKTAKSQAEKDLSDALAKKISEEEKKQKTKDNLSANELALTEGEKTLTSYKVSLNNLNVQKQKLEDEIATKEILKVSMEEKIESLKSKNS